MATLNQLVKRYKMFSQPLNYEEYFYNTGYQTLMVAFVTETLELKPQRVIGLQYITPNITEGYRKNFLGGLKIEDNGEWRPATAEEVSEGLKVQDSQVIYEGFEKSFAMTEPLKDLDLHEGEVFGRTLGLEGDGDVIEGAYIIIVETALGWQGVRIDSGRMVTNAVLRETLKDCDVRYDNIDEAFGARPGKKMTLITEGC